MGNSNSACVVFLGCPKNQVDSEHVLGSLTEAGYRLTTDQRAADLIVITTCAFLQSAVRESEAAVVEALKHKQGSPSKRVVVAGCLVERYGKSLKRKFPAVDLWVRLADMARIGQLTAIRPSPFASRFSPLASRLAPRVLSTPAHFAYLKIADGCDHRCAYCTVPSLRGPYRSRPPADVLSEAQRLAAEGVQEIILIAQDTSGYGRDLAPPASLPALLRGLGQLDWEGWLRVMYLHPARVNEELLAAMAEVPQVVPYVEMPLQHAAPGVLRRMGRAGGAEAYLALLGRIREHLPEAAIRSTFICGFPGETEAEFEELLAFVREARFDRVALFPYWPEEGTPAASLPHQVPAELAQERLEAVRELAESLSLEKNESLVGRRLRVLVERVEPPGAVGRSYRDAPEVDGEVLLAAPLPGEAALTPGEFVEATITAAQVHDLEGRPLPTPRTPRLAHIPPTGDPNP